MAWWNNLLPWDSAPLYTRPWTPDYFNPPPGYEGEGLEADVIQRNMPKSSVTWGQNYADQMRRSMELSSPPVRPPVPPVPLNIRGPTQAQDAPYNLAPGTPGVNPATKQFEPQPGMGERAVPTERFGMTPRPSPTPPPFPSTPPMNADRASRASMGVFDPRNTPDSVGTVPVGGLKTSYSNDEFKHRLITYGEATPDGRMSPAGALGVAQFMPQTWAAVGKMMGRPADAPGREDKTESMLRYNYYMDHLLKKYGGNQVDVAVAYNAGEGFANKWIAAGRPQNMLPGETRRYIANIFGGRSTQFASSSPETTTATSGAQPEIRSAATAPSTGPQAPERLPWYERNKDWITMLSQDLGALGRGMIQAQPGQNALGVGFANVHDSREKRLDTDLKRELLRSQIAKAKQGNPTELMRNYQMARLQGYKGTIMEYVADLEAKKKKAELDVSREAAEAQIGKTFAKSAQTVLENVAAARKEAKENWWTTGAPAWATGWAPFSPAGEMAGKVRTIKANIAFDRLAQMRIDSPTGGALGQVAVEELRNLQNSIADLENARTQETFLKSLDAVERHYRAIMDKYGSRLYSPDGQRAGSSPSSSNVPRLNRDGSWQ